MYTSSVSVVRTLLDDGLSRILVDGVAIASFGDMSRVLVDDVAVTSFNGISKALVDGVAIASFGDVSRVLVDSPPKILADGLCKVLTDDLRKVLVGGVSKVLLVLCSLFVCSERSRRRAVGEASLRCMARGATAANVSSGSLTLLAGVSLARATIGGLADTDAGKSERASSALINIEILA